MRGLRAIGFILSLGIFLLAGCARVEPPAGVLRVGIGTQPATLDPQLMTGLSEMRVLSALFEGLVVPDMASKEGVAAGVAAAWKVDNEGCVYTFYLRSEARWSDGQKVKAEDFVWSWRRGLSKTLAAPNAQLAEIIKGAKEYKSGSVGFEKVGCVALDSHTLRVELEKPDALFLRNLTHPFFYPLRRDCLEKFGDSESRSTRWTNPGDLVGNGAFKLTGNRIYQKVRVEKNPHYRGAVEPKLSAIEFYPIENRSSEEMAFLGGTLDVTLALPLSKVEAYKKDPRLRVDDALQVEMILLNTRVAPLDKLEVRRMLSLSLNRGELCEKLLRAGQKEALNIVPPATGGGYKPLLSLCEDEEAAKKIWESLANTEKEQFAKLAYRFNSSEARKAVAETLQGQWKKTFGQSIALENMEWKSYLAARASGDFSLTRTGWIADINDPSDFLNLFKSDNPNNYTGWKNNDYDRLLEARRFEEAEALLLSELPVIPLYFNPNVYLLSERVKGWEANPMDYHDWRRVEVR